MGKAAPKQKGGGQDDAPEDKKLLHVVRPAGKLHRVRKMLPTGMNISRKELRKEMRSMKKARRDAYYRKAPV